MNTLPDLLPGRLALLVAPHAACDQMLEFAAILGRRGPLLVLDGGNRFNVYRVARALRRTGCSGLVQALERIHVARAFTCYQMAALLEQTPAGAIPTLVIDLLDTFYDESAPLVERRQLLQRCTGQLRRLSQHAVVVASLRPPPPGQEDPLGLQPIVHAAADVTWIAAGPSPPAPLRLF